MRRAPHHRPFRPRPIAPRPRPITPRPSCGGEIGLNSQARITTPNYPGNYDNDLTCTWTITAPTGSRIKLEFVDFDLEGDGNCPYDFVSIFEGIAARELIPSNRCGTSGGGPYYTSNQMTIEFHTDGSTTGKGFDARLAKVSDQETTENYEDPEEMMKRRF